MPDFSNRLDIICLESEAFYALVEEVVNRMKTSHWLRWRRSPEWERKNLDYKIAAMANIVDPEIRTEMLHELEEQQLTGSQ